MATRITTISYGNYQDMDRTQKEQEFGYCVGSPIDALKQLAKKYPIAKYRDFPMRIFMDRYSYRDGVEIKEGRWGIGIGDSTSEFGTICISLDIVRMLAEDRNWQPTGFDLNNAGRNPYGVAIKVPVIVTASVNDLVERLQFQARMENNREQANHSFHTMYERDSREWNETMVFNYLKAEYLHQAAEVITKNGTLREHEFQPKTTLDKLIVMDNKFLSLVEAAEALSPDFAELIKRREIEQIRYTKNGDKDASFTLKLGPDYPREKIVLRKQS